jgi:hypothetical protein
MKQREGARENSDTMVGARCIIYHTKASGVDMLRICIM